MSALESTGTRTQYDENGVDRTLIRAYLRLTPTECLDLLEEMHQLAESAKHVDEPLPSAD
jgi:hypothetical protein